MKRKRGEEGESEEKERGGGREVKRKRGEEGER